MLVRRGKTNWEDQNIFAALGFVWRVQLLVRNVRVSFLPLCVCDLCCADHPVVRDNAGSDVVLGMIPLARELVRAGTEVRISHL